MLRKLPLAMSIALALMPLQSQALGLGKIKTNSVLNQPFDAEIQLLSVPPGELDGVKVSLANIDAFKRAGIDRPFLLSKLKFETERKPNGQAVVKVFSRNLIQEPFLNFLVEVNWPKGRMVREFTVLLDPPLTTGRKARAVSAPSASTVTSTTAGGRAMQPQRVPVVAADGEYGPVKNNETLWQIADRYRPSGISVQQMMQAVLAANPQAFYGNNINNLKAGSILRIPEKDEISISHSEAVSLSQQQYTDWKQGTSKAVKQPAEVAEKTQAAAAAEAAPAVDTESQTGDDDARLKLSGSEVAEQMGSGVDSDIESIKQELIAAQEKAVSSETEAQELREMTANLEKQLADMKRLIELKDEQLSKLQAANEAGISVEELEETIEVTTEDEVAETEEAVVVEEEPVTTEAVDVMEPEAVTEEAVIEEAPVTEEIAETEPVVEEPVAQAPAPEETEQKQPAKEESLLDMITGSATMMGIAIAVLVVLLALIWSAFSRRKGADEEDTVTAPVAKAEKVEPAVPAAEPVPDEHPDEESVLSEFTPADLQSLEEQETGEVDPIAEADVYIAYGRFDQAEDLVKQALESEPGKIAYQHKLLEIYYANKDKEKYTALASEMHENGAEEADSDAWNRAKLMGVDLDPENPLFADAMDVPSVDLGDDLDMALSELESQLTDDASHLTDLDQVSEQLEEVNLEEVAGKTEAAIEEEIMPLPDVELDTSQTTTEAEDEKIEQLAAELESFDIDAETSTPISEDITGMDESLLPEEESLEDLAAELDEIDDVTTKLDLARAYIEMGDKEGARGILEEVLEEGSDAQKQEAETILSEIS